MIIKAKFNQNETLKRKLINLNSNKFIEGNYWRDNFWGSCNCVKCENIEGMNRLGLIIELVRLQIIKEYES